MPIYKCKRACPTYAINCALITTKLDPPHSTHKMANPSGSLEFAKTVYPFAGQGQAVPLTFAESAIVLVAEKTQDGWCRGYCAGKEGWFPASYVKLISKEEITQVSAWLVAFSVCELLCECHFTLYY